MNTVVFRCLSVVLIFFNANAKRCDHGSLIYEDMNCKAVGFDSEHCPIRYNCPNLKKTPGKCPFKGEIYNSGQAVNSSKVYCDFGCRCAGSENPDFVCAQGQCINWTPVYAPQDGCYAAFNLEKCCLSGENCPGAGSQVHQCVYNGITYKDGERFFPDDSCTMCVCQKGFKGEIEAPYCTNRRCDVELKYLEELQNYCAPVYNNRNNYSRGLYCCPNSFICPDNKTEVITGKARQSTAANRCRFGKKILSVGQGFVKETTDGVRQNVTCECRIPPLLTCHGRLY